MNVNFYWNDEYKEGIKYLPLHWTASVVEYFSRTGFQWLVLTSAFYRCLLVTRPAHARSWFSRLCVIFSVAWIVEFCMSLAVVASDRKIVIGIKVAMGLAKMILIIFSHVAVIVVLYRLPRSNHIPVLRVVSWRTRARLNSRESAATDTPSRPRAETAPAGLHHTRRRSTAVRRMSMTSQRTHRPRAATAPSRLQRRCERSGPQMDENQENTPRCSLPGASSLNEMPTRERYTFRYIFCITLKHLERKHTR